MGMASLTRRTTAPLWKTRCNVIYTVVTIDFRLPATSWKRIHFCLFLPKTIFTWKYLRNPFIWWSSFHWNSFSQSSTSFYILHIFPLDFFFTIFDLKGSKARLPWKVRERNVSENDIKKQNKIILVNNNNTLYTCIHGKHKMYENN